ncbi:Aste57867_13675 [Aphanomyces stellatus]|uniref:Aste57867_13675 protein n=1 Tax=Aphanomyces stellatus TaxID=120398 RepID=A0A485KZG3_9STRA|nr:hypothetical protein As57867_013625 [Aphanomyces stellatus]VFT90508.1 Aste57867_13675 [Aphanomyces stellatus]
MASTLSVASLGASSHPRLPLSLTMSTEDEDDYYTSDLASPSLPPIPDTKFDALESNRTVSLPAPPHVRTCVRLHCQKRQAGALLAYVFLNGGLFWWKCNAFPYDILVGYGTCVAKGSAHLIMLNSCVLLWFLSRSVLHFVLRRHDSIGRILPFEFHKQVHTVCGWAILVSSLVHSAAHGINLYRAYDPPHHVVNLDASNYMRHIPVLHPHVQPLGRVLATLPMWTGLLLLALLLVALPPSLLPCIRRRFHTLFWLTHLLLVPFLVVVCFHGATGWLQPPQAYLWIAPPLLLYLLERRFRCGTSVTATPVVLASASHYDKAIVVEFEKPRGFHFTPGMYVLLNAPAIARHEWHPFSIASAPQDPLLRFHIQVGGSWTCAMAKALDGPQPTIFLDGPIGGTCISYHRFQTVLLVGAGSGVTPFVSIVRDLIHQKDTAQNVYLHLVTRHDESRQWMADTWHTLEAVPMLEATAYVTQPGAGPSTDANVQHGRPNWTHIWTGLEHKHGGETVGVFFCGPQSLAKVLARLCSDHRRATFLFHAEVHR